MIHTNLKHFFTSHRLDLLNLVILTAVTTVVLKYYFVPGMFETHDGRFHVIRISHLARELLHGQFPVRLAQDMLYGYGYPVFNYTYPLPYYLSAMMVLAGGTLVGSLKLLIILATYGSIMAMYLWLRLHSSRLAASVGALAFLLVPYRLASLYVTGQLGTVLAFFWAPVVLIALWLGANPRYRRYGVALLATSGSGLLLSHILSAYILVPLFLGYSLYLLKANTQQAGKTLKTMLLGSVLALLLAAFYWVPAVAEAPLVKMGHQAIVQATDHFATPRQLLYSAWGYGYSGAGESDGMSFQLGLAQWVILALAAGLLVLRRNKLKQLGWALVLLTVTGLALWLTMDWSLWLWQHVPLLSQTQYPWRWLLLVAVSLAGLSAWLVEVLPGFKLRLGLVICLAVLMSYANRNHLRPMQVAFYEDSHYLSSVDYYGSADISQESLPVAVTQVPDKPTDYIDARWEDEVKPELGLPPGQSQYRLNSPVAGEVSLPKFYFPMWQVELAGETVVTYPDRQGLIAFHLPQGEHHIITRLNKTRVQKMAEAISLGGLVLLVGFVSLSLPRQSRLEGKRP